MKVLFLDFDGVLNTDLYVRNKNRYGVILEPSKMILLKDIIEKTQAKIVIHTSWRRYWSQKAIHWIGKDINEIFLQYGLWIDDKTSDRLNRKESIEEYIKRYDIKQFVVVDDIYIDSYLIKNSFVRTQSVYGLTNELAKDIINKLGG